MRCILKIRQGLLTVRDLLTPFYQTRLILQVGMVLTAMIVILKKAYDAAEAAGKHGFSNFLAERMDAHEKHGWMLRASSKGGQ